MASTRRLRRKVPASVTTQLATLMDALERCVDRVAELERENDIQIKRMAAIQAELDHLRAKMR